MSIASTKLAVMLPLVFIILCVLHSVRSLELQDVIDERQMLINSELNLTLGSDIVLSASEIIANEIIMDLKNKVLEDGFHNPQNFYFTKHFFKYKDEIKRTELFKLLQDMPKGAVLHAHDTGMLSPDYVLNITYMDNLYACFEEDDVIFQFSKELPTSTCRTQWQLMRDARYSSGNVDKFDKSLRKYFTLVVDNPHEEYPDINGVWNTFERYFKLTMPLMTFKPVWEQYFYDALTAFRADNVMYLEWRGDLPTLFDLEGNSYDSMATAEIYKRVIDKFIEVYPDFYGAKLIYAPLRVANQKAVTEYLTIAREIQKRFPGLLAGFDMVGQEDIAMPYKEFLPQLFEARNELDYFFHAGETNWFGTTSDENLVDAIVLNSKRIGHAFALIKHPLLIEAVKKRGIAIEINVISNHVLKLVEDVRNHPLASFLAQGLPVVISSDDPGVWEADPISHDYYAAFVGVASRHSDLRLLKKLILNSLYYSTYPNKEKILHEFEIRWTKFIDAVVKRKHNAR